MRGIQKIPNKDGTKSDDLELGSNWNPAVVATGIAYFDNTISGIVTTPAVVGPDSFSLNNFSFLHEASPFSFTINGPYALQFYGHTGYDGHRSLF